MLWLGILSKFCFKSERCRLDWKNFLVSHGGTCTPFLISMIFPIASFPPPVRVYVAFSDILMPEELPLSFIIPHPLPNVSSIYFLLSFIFGGSSVKEFSTTVKLLGQVWQLEIALKPPWDWSYRLDIYCQVKFLWIMHIHEY